LQILLRQFIDFHGVADIFVGTAIPLGKAVAQAFLMLCPLKNWCFETFGD
jgi:hypothetical protein